MRYILAFGDGTGGRAGPHFLVVRKPRNVAGAPTFRAFYIGYLTEYVKYNS